MHRFATILAGAALLAAAPAVAQWGRGGCAPAGPVGSSLLAPAPAYRWQPTPSGWYQLWRDGEQLGCYHPAHGYVKLLAVAPDEWSPPCTPPVSPPVPRAVSAAAPVGQNFGVELDKLGQGGCAYKINGQPAGRAEVIQLLSKSNLEDDSRKLRLVVIGPEDVRRQVLADVRGNPELARLTRDFLVQEYAPEHWHVAQAGFATGGRPSIYLLLPQADGKGKVLHHQDDYQGGAQALARAIRRADPSYDPTKDPDLRTGAIDFSRVPPWAWIVAAVAVTALLARNKP